MMPPVDVSRSVAVVLDVAAWAVLHAGTGYVAHRLPESFCSRDNVLLRLRAFERSGRLWRALRVKRWKDRVPEAGAFYRGGVSKRTIDDFSDGGLRRFAALTRRAEMAHWLAMFSALLFAIWNELWVVAIMVVYAVAVNFPFIAIQRYNRLRVSALLDARAERRASVSSGSRPEARARSAAETTGSSIP